METTPLLGISETTPASPSRTRQSSRNFDLDAYLRDADIDDDDNCDDDPFMATMPLYTLISPWLVLIAMVFLTVAFVLAILGSRDPVYTLSPSDCDDDRVELYTNVSSWYLGDWNLLYGRGACPVEASGMKTVYIKQGNDLIAQTYWTYSYCLNNDTQWAHIDEMNALKGLISTINQPSTNHQLPLTSALPHPHTLYSITALTQPCLILTLSTPPLPSSSHSLLHH